MQIQINDVLRDYIEPLTAAERSALERSLLAEGCRDALVLWNDVLVDGHNRYSICQQHGIPFKVTQNTSFKDMEDVMLWMIDNHLGRRSVSDFQRGVLALRQQEILAKREQAVKEQAKAEDAAIAPPDPEAEEPAPPPKTKAKREDIARAARLSANTLGQIEKITRSATPELVEAVRSGTISINAAATVASLSEEDQKSAVAGGRKFLQQAAREIREQRAANRPPKPPKEGADEGYQAAERPAPLTEVEVLRLEISQLKEKNAALRAENAELRERIAQLVEQ